MENITDIINSTFFYGDANITNSSESEHWAATLVSSPLVVVAGMMFCYCCVKSHKARVNRSKLGGGSVNHTPYPVEIIVNSVRNSISDNEKILEGQSKV